MEIVYLLQPPLGNWLIDEIHAVEKILPNLRILTLTAPQQKDQLKTYVQIHAWHKVLGFLYLLFHLKKSLLLISKFSREIGWQHTIRAFSFLPYLKRWKTVHIHCHFGSTTTSVALLLHELTAITFSFTAHAYDIFEDRVNRALLIEKMQKAVFIRTISDYNKSYLASLAPTQKYKIEVIHCGIMLDHFPSRPRAAKINTPTIISASNLVEKKGFHKILECFPTHDSYSFIDSWKIAGDGKSRFLLEKLIAERKISKIVDLLPLFNHDELPVFFQSGDVFLLPCIVTPNGNRDGIPVILMEAMAAGCIVISTKVSGIPELIDHSKNGFLLKEASFNHLHQTLNTISWLSKEEIKNIRTNARKTVETHFNIEKIAVEIKMTFKKYIA